MTRDLFQKSYNFGSGKQRKNDYLTAHQRILIDCYINANQRFYYALLSKTMKYIQRDRESIHRPEYYQSMALLTGPTCPCLKNKIVINGTLVNDSRVYLKTNFLTYL